MILVFGEALIDLTPADCGGSSGFVPRPGGSPYNVAIGLARLGVASAFAGGISTDPFGRRLLETLEAEDVDTSLVAVSGAPSPLAFVFLDQEGRADYSFHLLGTAFTEPAALPHPLPADVHAVHVGSIALAVEPVAAAAGELLRRAHTDRLTTLDPNIRPAFVPNRGDFRLRLEQRLADVDLVKASVEDLAWLYPGEPVVDVARRWCGLGPAVVVVTRGAAGAVAVRPDGVVDVPGEPVEVVDTVGAGDAFMSGLLWWLTEHGAGSRTALMRLDTAALLAALRSAQSVASLTCTRHGADPPRRHEVADER